MGDESAVKGFLLNDPSQLSYGIGEITTGDLDGKPVFGLIVDNSEYYLEMMFTPPVVEKIKEGISKYEEELKRMEYEP